MMMGWESGWNWGWMPGRPSAPTLPPRVATQLCVSGSLKTIARNNRGEAAVAVRSFRLMRLLEDACVMLK
jgi:hypothetical protein